MNFKKLKSRKVKKILFIDTLHPLFAEELTKIGFLCIDGTKLSKEEIKKTIHEYFGMAIRSRIMLDKEILACAKDMKFIARAGAGMESIDVDYAEKKKIICLNAPEGNRDAVAEHALGMLLNLFNNINKADCEIRNGKWIREGNRGIELQGKTVGIIGYGNMGSAFAKRLSGFGVKVMAYDKYKKKYGNKKIRETNLTEIFKETDVLSLHVPLTEETTYMVNDEFINRFKKNIFLINTARGKVVDTAALVKNMQTGKILGACLDVLEYEDTSFEKFGTNLQSSTPTLSPLQFLLESNRVLLTPHIAGWTFESNEKIAKTLVEKIKQIL